MARFRLHWTTSDGTECRSVEYTREEAERWCRLGQERDPHLNHRVVKVVLLSDNKQRQYNQKSKRLLKKKLKKAKEGKS